MRDKSLGTILALPPPPSPITMLIFSGRENADESIDGSNIPTLSGGKGDSKNKRTKRITRVSVMWVEGCIVKFSSFCPSMSSVPRSYDLHCSSCSCLTCMKFIDLEQGDMR